jgi:hypothetical protein
MKYLLKTIAITSILLLVFAGCRATSIYNVQNAPVTVKQGATMQSVFIAIKRGGYKRGWQVTKIKDGLAKAYIDVRGKHQATVMIKYDLKTYSITYESSNNLKYNSNDNTIHKNYNSWVRNLDKDIQFELGML